MASCCDDVISNVTPANSDGDVCYSKEASTITVQANSRVSLPSKFGRYWTTNKLYDMVITCRQQRFEVHRVILSGLSDFFEEAISEQLENDTLTMDYDPVNMNACLEYLYTGRVEVDRDRVGAVANLAKILDIPHLYNTCRAADLKDATACVDNCLDMWRVADAVGDEEMLLRGKGVALSNMDDLMEQESFMNLSYCHLEELVLNEDLVVAYAGDRLAAALVWVCHDSSTRSQHLTSLLLALPLNEMSRVSLRQVLYNPVIKEHEEAYQLIRQSIGGREAETKSKPLMASSMVTCLVSMGRNRHDGHTDNDRAVMVTPLSFTSKWFKLTDLPSSLPSHKYASVACYAVGSSLYVTGLGRNLKETWHFKMDTMHWERYGDLQHSRESSCLVECNGTVYSLGGRVPGGSFKLVPHVEALDLKTKTWRAAGSLSGSVCINAACCVKDREVLIYGVLDDANNRLVQVYSPQSELSRCLGSFKCGQYRGACGVVSVAEKIVMADHNGVYVCSASQHTKFHVAQRPLHKLPSGGSSVLYPSDDDQFIMTICGWSRDGSANHVYRARVDDVINEMGPGWQPVHMEWSLEKRHLLPGAHCTASIDLYRLSQS